MLQTIDRIYDEAHGNYAIHVNFSIDGIYNDAHYKLC